MLHHTRDLYAARVCSPSQASENLRSSSGRLSHPPGPDRTASLVDGYTRCALDQMHISRPTLASDIARLAPGLRYLHAPRALHHIEALPRHGCSRPLAPHAHAGQSHCKIDGQSCGARAGGASTCWVLLVAVRDMRTVYRGATPILACGQRRRRHRRVVMILYHLLVDPPTQYFLNSRSKLSESCRVR